MLRTARATHAKATHCARDACARTTHCARAACARDPTQGQPANSQRQPHMWMNCGQISVSNHYSNKGQWKTHRTVVNNRLGGCEGCVVRPCERYSWAEGGWYNGRLFATSYVECEETPLESCNYIRSSAIGHCTSFKLGFTECPWTRWNERGWYKDEGWTKMVVLHAAKSSKTWVHDSTGSMENVW